MGNKEVQSNEIAAHLERGDEDLFVLDVRNEDDYKEWQTAGNYNLPIYDQLLNESFVGLKASLELGPNNCAAN